MLKLLRQLFPFHPYALAVYLLLLSLGLAFMHSNQGFSLIFEGLWNSNGLVFMVQMLLMLLLGLNLAKSNKINRIILSLCSYAHSSKKAYIITALVSGFGCWINWGLGLILGAIMARKCAEYLSKNNIAFNYPLLGALGYSGMMIWHNGLSASALLKAAEPKALINLVNREIAGLPHAISINESIFSLSNFFVSAAILCFILVWVYFSPIKEKQTAVSESVSLDQGVAKHHDDYLGVVLGIILIISLFYSQNFDAQLRFITPNFINTCLLACNLVLYKSLNALSNSIEQNLGTVSGIVLQFPLYFAIMALLSKTGVIADFSQLLSQSLPPHLLDYTTFISAAIINFFVPSGGGQWLIQGPIIIESYMASGVEIKKGLMAMAYGDELTNMLQPFWALPVLAITGLKAKEILPFTFRLFLIGLVCYGFTITFN